MLISLFENYPFKNIGISILAGFSESGGVDYALLRQGEFVSFEVFSMYEGDFRFGVSDAYGKYFIVSKVVGDFRYDTIYARLEHVNEELQKYAIIQGDKDFMVPAKYFLGWASTAGNSKGSRFLHIELHEKNLKTGERRKIDPYGLYASGAVGRYPQPGQTLSGLDHCWLDDGPFFAQ